MRERLCICAKMDGMPGKPIHQLIFGGALAGAAFGNAAFGWFRSFDWLHKNAPSVWGVIVTPEFQYTLIALALVFSGTGLWEWWKHRGDLRKASQIGQGHSQVTYGNNSPSQIAGRDINNQYVHNPPPKSLPHFQLTSAGYRWIFINDDHKAGVVEAISDEQKKESVRGFTLLFTNDGSNGESEHASVS